MFEEAADFMRTIGVEPPDREDLRYGGVVGSVFVEDPARGQPETERCRAFANRISNEPPDAIAIL